MSRETLDTLFTMATAPASAIIARALEDQIASGELRPGDRTPSVRELAREFGVSPATASRALAQLVALGLVDSRPGVGMIVLQRAPSQLLARDRAAVAQRTGAINRPGEYAKRISAGTERADARVRAGLGIETTRAFCRRRVRYDRADRPIEHSASWFTLDVVPRAPRLRNLSPIDEGTLAYVQEATGRTVASTHEDIYAREADNADVLHGIATNGRPVLVVEFVAYDENERPLTFETAVFPESMRVVSTARPT
jgi:DNA-binding GntR family transcriptional regulator